MDPFIIIDIFLWLSKITKVIIRFFWSDWEGQIFWRRDASKLIVVKVGLSKNFIFFLIKNFIIGFIPKLCLSSLTAHQNVNHWYFCLLLESERIKIEEVFSVIFFKLFQTKRNKKLQSQNVHVIYLCCFLTVSGHCLVSCVSFWFYKVYKRFLNEIMRIDKINNFLFFTEYF